MTPWILAVLLGLHGIQPGHPELSIIADAIARAAAGDRELAALLITTGYHESRFELRIQEGRCRPYECDAVRLPDGRVIHLARSYWQLQRTSFVPRWHAIVGAGPEPTLEAAVSAARILRQGRRNCRSLEGALSFYATGRCKWSGAGKRAALARRMLSQGAP